ncbi:MAG: permease [Candidatus Heimdallarchaeota archaeon]|nr:permease [Candidatus Heimdallarchaeota archaeon]
MSVFWEKVLEMLLGGVYSLADYLSLHVLLCLIPAFFIAGAMVVFVPKDTIVKYMGKDTKRIIAYPVAAISGLLLAVCSCTVLPLFAGIKKKGAGLGPAMTFLFSAPAVNILALTYTGVLIGMDIAIARAVLALGFAIIIGLIMEFIFKEKPKVEAEKEDIESNQMEEETSTELKRSNKGKKVLDGVLVSFLLVTGVLLAFLNKSNLQAININNPPLIQTIIWGFGLVLLTTIFFVIKNSKINIFLGLLYLLFTGTSQISYFSISGSSTEPEISRSFEYFMSEAFRIDLMNMGIKTALSIAVALVITIYVIKKVEKEEGKEWMRETWAFVKQIFPFLILGVFLAGILSVLIPADFIQDLVGENTVIANLIGVLFGVVAYFPTLMEVPIAKMFLNLGMSRGVLLAYLLADPVLSIQSVLVTRKFIGDKKNFVYLLLVIVLTVLAGLLFGLVISNEPIQFI